MIEVIHLPIPSASKHTPMGYATNYNRQNLPDSFNVGKKSKNWKNSRLRRILYGFVSGKIHLLLPSTSEQAHIVEGFAAFNEMIFSA